MDNSQLRENLQRHEMVLRDSGIEVSPVELSPPATSKQVDDLEEQLGIVLPDTFRAGLTTVAASVNWSWRCDEPFDPPFDGIGGGELRWSVDTLAETHAGYQGWIDSVYPDADDAYGFVWHNKLGWLEAEGDYFAVDLDPTRAGAIVYVSHDGGAGHDYVVAESLTDLMDRWVPLACPGPEDWQWLPFVPWDEGPIDPTCDSARGWRQMLGLSIEPLHTTRVQPTPEQVADLLEQYRRSPTSKEGRWAGRRALKCCGPSQLPDVLSLLRSGDEDIQDLAATVLGKLGGVDAVPALIDTARTGHHNARLSAIAALHKMPGPDAQAAISMLHSELGPNWVYLP